MGRLDGESQALALGLLNLADDEGYFMADPSIVRSALRPFDDSSTTIRRCLDECSRAGWIEVRRHPTHGAIGLVVNFRRHQRIDRPKESNLVQYWQVATIDDESTMNRRRIDDESLLEGKGREGKGREVEEEPLPPPLPVAAFEIQEPDMATIESWPKEDFWRAAEVTRRARGFPPQKWPNPVALSRWWGEARAIADVTTLARAFTRFADDPHWSTRTPPAPFAGFMTQWNNFLPKRTA